MKKPDWPYIIVFSCGIAIAAAFLMALFASQARAESYISVGLGNTQYTQPGLGSGFWHQAPEYGTAFYPDSQARNLVIGHQVTPWLSVEAGVWDFGKSEIYGKWTSDYAYEHKQIGVYNFDTGFTQSHVKGTSVGIRFNTNTTVDLYVRLHYFRYETDFRSYNTYGSAPTSTTIDPWNCRLRDTEFLKGVGLKYRGLFIEQVQFNTTMSNGLTGFHCHTNVMGAKTVFVGYEWRFK